MKKGAGFPGFDKCLQIMRSSNGDTSESGFGWIDDRAAEFVPQLIAAFWDDDNARIQGWLIELIGDATSPAAMPFLLERLHDDDELIRDWAILGLRQLNTKEARTALWRSGYATDARS